MYTDGGSRNNPGPAAIGYVIYDQSNRVIIKGSKYIGKTTNNVAEYMGLYVGVLKLKELECTKVDIYLDSELVVKQMQGKYKIKNQDLIKIQSKIVSSLVSIEWTISWIPREKNSVADALVNQELDRNH
jgi:ribonuclease HI